MDKYTCISVHMLVQINAIGFLATNTHLSVVCSVIFSDIFRLDFDGDAL